MPKVMQEELFIIAGGLISIALSSARRAFTCMNPGPDATLLISASLSERHYIHCVYIWYIDRKWHTDDDLTVEEPDLSPHPSWLAGRRGSYITVQHYVLLRSTEFQMYPSASKNIAKFT
jgi:hypothetical protein